MRNQHNASIAQRDQAKISFEKAVTQAFGEVSASVSAQHLAKAYREKIASVDAYRESVGPPSAMTAVFLGYLDIIDDAQIQLYPAESATVNYGPVANCRWWIYIVHLKADGT